MNIAIYSRDEGTLSNPRFVSMVETLSKGPFEFYRMKSGEDIRPA